MMNNLEDKIKEYLEPRVYGGGAKDWAHDIAEIIQKETLLTPLGVDIVARLETENDTLKEQIDMWKKRELFHIKCLKEKEDKIIDLEAKLLKRNGRILELEEKLKEYEINEDEKFGIAGIEAAVKEAYGGVSKDTIARIYQILTDNRKQFIKNLEAI